MTTDEGLRLVPEMYSVPEDQVQAEYEQPGSVDRSAVGQLPFMWAQSLYITGRLLQDVCYLVFFFFLLLDLQQNWLIERVGP